MMNEITRIHIAKTAYDIEIAAKKQLEKYIKSLETYAQDADVVTDIEIRITELLAERSIKPGGVINSEDVSALRKQLGEPYEFAGEEGDIAVGSENENSSTRRLYRSTDNAVLAGVLSGISAFFNINPLWMRLAFVVLIFMSFGLAALGYILAWIIIPPARTATEKLKLAGKVVTAESIKALNADEEKARPNQLAPVLQTVLTAGLGSLSALTAILVFIGTIWLIIGAFTLNAEFMDLTNSFNGLGEGYTWLVWLLFWITLFGLVLFTALCSLVAYAFFARKITKTMIISGIVIIVLGIASAASVVGISATQSMRVANETRSLVRETKVTLPKEFNAVRSLDISVNTNTSNEHDNVFSQYAQIRYIVEDGPARYELSALPTAKMSITSEGEKGSLLLEIPNSYRNSFVQPILTIYGPALETISGDTGIDSASIEYIGAKQDTLTIISTRSLNINVTGSFASVIAKGSGSIDLSSSAVQALDVQAEDGLWLIAGTVRTLTVSQPEACASGTYQDSTSVTVAGVASETMRYNGQDIPAQTHRTSCAIVVVDSESEYDGYSSGYDL